MTGIAASAAHALGVDLSITSTGLVCLSALDGSIVWEATVGSRKRASHGSCPAAAIRRIEPIVAKIHTRVEDLASRDPLLVVLEGYAYTPVAGRITDLAELAGVVKWHLSSCTDVIMVVVPPAQLKKFATGKGNAPKDHVRLGVYKRWGYEARSNDLVDAYVLAQIGLALLSPSLPLTKPQSEVIERVRAQQVCSTSETT